MEFESIRGIEVYIGLLEQEEEAITMMSSFIVYLYPGGSPLFNRNCLLRYREVVSWGHQAFCTGEVRTGSRDVILTRRPVF